jgi:hypothetical protein
VLNNFKKLILKEKIFSPDFLYKKSGEILKNKYFCFDPKNVFFGKEIKVNFKNTNFRNLEKV